MLRWGSDAATQIMRAAPARFQYVRSAARLRRAIVHAEEVPCRWLNLILICKTIQWVRSFVGHRRRHFCLHATPPSPPRHRLADGLFFFGKA